MRHGRSKFCTAAARCASAAAVPGIEAFWRPAMFFMCWAPRRMLHLERRAPSGYSTRVNAAGLRLRFGNRMYTLFV